jgi:hypothetical protein
VGGNFLKDGIRNSTETDLGDTSGEANPFHVESHTDNLSIGTPEFLPNSFQLLIILGTSRRGASPDERSTA